MEISIFCLDLPPEDGKWINKLPHYVLWRRIVRKPHRRAQDYLLYAIPMLDFEPEFNVGLWTQFSLIKGSNLILELEPDDPIGQFNNMFWTSANDSISLSKKLTCWVLKGPTGQSSPGKATESRGVGVGVGGIIIHCFRFRIVSDSIWTTWFILLKLHHAC